MFLCFHLFWIYSKYTIVVSKEKLCSVILVSPLDSPLTMDDVIILTGLRFLSSFSSCRALVVDTRTGGSSCRI